MSYRSLGSDEVTLRNYRPVGRRKGNMSLSDPLAAGVIVDLPKPGLSGIGIRIPRRRLIFCRYFIQRFNRREHKIAGCSCFAGANSFANGRKLRDLMMRSQLSAMENPLNQPRNVSMTLKHLLS